MNKIIIAFLLLAFGFSAKAQNDNDIKLSALPYYTYGKGLGLTSPDSIFKLNIRFRMQNRATYLELENAESGVEGMIRRLRLKFDGYVGNPKIVYVIQLSFSPGDVGVIEDGDNLNVIRDAIVFYRPNEHWNIGFGQTKLPGNRQRINSSGALELTDRTINNASFNIDRDFGLQVYYLNEKPDSFYYNIKTAISTGEGRNWTELPQKGLAYTGRLELYPFGEFTDNGAFFEGDVLREPTPKLMISGAYQYNEGARRTRGTLGVELYEQRNLQSVLIDAIVKYNGWAFETAFMNRMADDPITFNPENSSQFRYVVVGQGFDAQLSYVFRNNYSLIGRFSTQEPNKDVVMLMPETQQYTFGVTKYIWEHSLKLQAEITKTDFTLNTNPTINDWYFRFQVEIGI